MRPETWSFENGYILNFSDGKVERRRNEREGMVTGKAKKWKKTDLGQEV